MRVREFGVRVREFGARVRDLLAVAQPQSGSLGAVREHPIDNILVVKVVYVQGYVIAKTDTTGNTHIAQK